MVRREFGSQASKECFSYSAGNIGTIGWVKQDYFPFIYLLVVQSILIFQPVCVATVFESWLVRSGCLIKLFACQMRCQLIVGWRMPTKMRHLLEHRRDRWTCATYRKYVGLTETAFKQRYYNHLTTLRHENKSNTTELSKHIWKLNYSNISYNIKWNIFKKLFHQQVGNAHYAPGRNTLCCTNLKKLH